MAARIEFEPDAVKQAVEWYVDLGYGLVDIAKEYGVSAGAIRSLLLKNGVKLRGRGRPRCTE